MYKILLLLEQGRGVVVINECARVRESLKNKMKYL